jgi:hypothetical protein
MLFDKLRQIEERSHDIARRLADPAIFSQQAEYARLRKEHSDTQEIVERFTGPDYGWMWPFPSHVNRWFDQALQELEPLFDARRRS